MAIDDISTEDQSFQHHAEGNHPSPGVVLIFANRRPCFRVLETGKAGCVLGRHISELSTERRTSRRHALVHHDGERFHIEDLGSQNGTYIDGKRIRGKVTSSTARVLRLGEAIALLFADVGGHLRHGVKVVDGRVIGPEMAVLFDVIAGFSTSSPVLHIHGESGTGKEDAARSYHTSGPHASGPFVAVNCATLPEGLAERLLFGAVRGAYSGASHDAIGYLQAAHGGTLFLDEIADLDLSVQAKLLRAIETREISALGSTRPRPIDLRLCTATHGDLRNLVAQGRMRTDLYYRIGMPTISLSPLRERLADIPFLIDLEVSRAAPELSLHPSFVESCLLRPWPGNVRELLASVRMASQIAKSHNSNRLDMLHLPNDAGTAISSSSAGTATNVSKDERTDEFVPLAATGEGLDEIREAAIREALRKSGGNITIAARALGLHRTQLRRWMKRHEIEPRQDD